MHITRFIQHVRRFQVSNYDICQVNGGVLDNSRYQPSFVLCSFLLCSTRSVAYSFVESEALSPFLAVFDSI